MVYLYCIQRVLDLRLRVDEWFGGDVETCLEDTIMHACRRRPGKTMTRW